jgi:hypothetical protein
MGYLRKKLINGQDKYYWIVSKRDGKKEGGTGNVKKVEYYLGNSLGYLTYLSWYLWSVDINLDECLNKLVTFYLNIWGLKNDVIYQLSSKNKLILRSSKNSYVDLRKKHYQSFKNFTQYYIDTIINDYKEFDLKIDKIIEYLKNYNETISLANEIRLRDTDLYFINCELADGWFTYAQKDLEKLLTKIPKTQKEIGKDRIWGHCLRKCPLMKLEL